MRASRLNSEQEQWRGYLDPASVVVRELGYGRQQMLMRGLVDGVKLMRKFEKEGALAEWMAKNNVPFAVALRVLNLPPERSVKLRC